ncbi:MAG: YceI family protein [Balneolaceae bacterium]|nr:YceI family protein [Balneolaceae bacterium]
MSTGEVFSFQSTFVPINESRLWIQGSSNVNQFECYAENYSGEATVPNEVEETPSVINASSELLLLKIDIEVDSFECGKQSMNKDLQKALQAEKFPEITFLYQNTTLLSEPQNRNDGFELRVHGLLTVAGTTKEIYFNTEAYYINQQRVRAVGKTTINMTDFGVEPPTALMGLIRANEELTVNFDLIAEPQN